MRADVLRELIDITIRDINSECAEGKFLCNTNDMEINFLKSAGDTLNLEFLCDIYYKEGSMWAGTACAYIDIKGNNICKTDVFLDIDTEASCRHDEIYGE